MNFTLDDFIKWAIAEDLGDGDHTTLATIDHHAHGKARLLVKESCVIAGIELANHIFHYYDKDIVFNAFAKDGDKLQPGQTAFEIEGKIHTILSMERLVLNCMQRMSAIATYTYSLKEKIKHTKTKLLDTRKTTPLNRYIEKWAVRIGGGYNHRMGLYDMIMIKDNHIDFCGGIDKAIQKVKEYQQKMQINLPVVIEARSQEDVNEILRIGYVQRILLDNFTPGQIAEAVKIIDGRMETEASGGINEENIVEYAESGVDYISVGALTHHIQSIDLSLKAC
ncbi:MAG: nicotinate-nucleotide diphosphorylase (carboxylating) [Vicingaceae bacterium]|nr:MAG: nicotinate-nucleotide diphosphorylase (carboxylating) [Vicingaceae bacterium]